MKNFPEGTTPKTIALHTSINVNTVKSILPKLTGIKRIIRGFYKVVEGGDTPTSPPSEELIQWTFHNCILSSQLKDYPGKLIESTNSFGIVNYQFTISTTGNATLCVSSDTPLNISSLCSVYAYFSELLSKYSNDSITKETTFIRTIEFNKDYSNLRLDGIKCITLDSLVEQFKVYQKKLVMRIEHKTKVNFTVENIVDMLTNNPNSLELNIKLAHQRTQIERLTEATNTNTKMLLKLIDRENRTGGVI